MHLSLPEHELEPMCSEPTLLDGLAEYINKDNVEVLQCYNPSTIVKQAFAGIKNKIVVVLFMEYHQLGWLERFLGKSNNYYVLVHNHDYPDYIKEKYKNNYTLIVDQTLYSYYVNKISNKDYVPKDKTLHFLSLNNRASPDRQSLFYFFEKYSLGNKSYFSYLGNLTNYKSYNQIADVIGTPWYVPDNLTKLHNKIPVSIAGDQFDGNDWSTGQDHYYQDTFCSIVLETYAFNQYPYFSEKVFKPIAFYHPFILNSNPGSLKILQDLGFKTFGDFWDESYDQLGDHDRLEAIFRLTLDISNWSTEHINKVYNTMLPILKHNHDHFFNMLPKMFAERKPKLFQEIKDIVEGVQL
jgi:hypothetical protein